jgi:ABC-type multidrug transport system ATPase subunit
MQIILENLSKKYNREWIFRGINKSAITGKPLAITGPNGSGKSTLMLIISGWTIPTSGKISYLQNDSRILDDEIYREIDFIAPYTELIEELTLEEFLKFHFKFKSLLSEITIEDIIRRANLNRDRRKYIRYFSSGMKQRLKLALGFYSSCPVLLLDEPTTNLDDYNKKWYFEEIKGIFGNKIIIIASNQPEEYTFAVDFVKIEDYK